MTYLLDTRTLIWAITEPDKLSDTVKSLIENPAEHIVVSAISFWEISLKYRLGKLQMDQISPEALMDVCKQIDLEMLPLDPWVCASYHQLKADYHGDPFDRMLIWFAIIRKMTILSKDRMLKMYESEGLQVIW
jgi:PIN domain nuclease of toxin-antitoxin system